MSCIITLNSTHIVQNGFNNILRYDFPGSSVNFNNAEIAIQSINMYNSQFNIDAVAYGNNTFSIQMPTGSTFSTINITLPDGYYSYTDINRLIQSNLVSAGAYLIDATGNNVYFVQLTANSTYYAAQLDLAVVPTTLGSYTRPATGLYSAGGSGLPTTACTPKFVNTNAEFGKIIGYATGTFPSTTQTTAQSFLSSIIPQIAPSSSYILRCSLVRNPYSMPPDVLTTFNSKGTSIGQQIAYTPTNYSFMNIPNGSYASIQLVIVDQMERFPKFRDTNMLITLLIRQKK
jgi:hypothetical protein